MRSQPEKFTRLGDTKKPEGPKGLSGLFVYGALTILAVLALVVVANS